MASSIPARLRTADIGRFALRAVQIEKVKPVVAYWCNFHIVNQIIERGLHNTDDEIKTYTTNLVDKLEQFKSENPDNETITDNVAASAYVEQFGLEVFGRAEAAMAANKVTKQTADTFQAAATFLELCQVWGDLDPEIAGRIKFAKYHAVRIVKAIKAGEDPNDTNPAPKEEEEATIDKPDVQAFDESVAEQASKPRQASVEEISDEADRVGRQLAHQSSLDESLHPSRTSSVPRPPAQAATPPEIPSVPQNAPGTPGREMNIDSVPGELSLPSAPDALGGPSSIPQLPDTPGSSYAHVPSPSQPDSFQSFPPPTASPSVPAPDPASFYSPSNASAHIPAPAAAANPRPAFSPAPVAPAPAVSSQLSHTVDDNAIALAQKHARWAVSAMTFDDVDTAIKELRNSLSASVKHEPTFAEEALAEEMVASHDDDDDDDDDDDELEEIELTSSSKLDMFRLFLDFRPEWWEGFKVRLVQYVICASSWKEISTDGAKRLEMAQRFVNQVGKEYWGSVESRKKFMLQRNIENRSVLRYPANQRVITQAIKLLLEKMSKRRRDSIAEIVIESRPFASASDAPSPQGNPKGLDSGAKAEKANMKDAELDSQLVAAATSGQLNATQYLSLHDADPVSRNFQATYFLVREEKSEIEAVCVPFEVFPSSSAFLAKMESHAGVIDLDDPSPQFYDEMPSLRRRYAVVRLQWSRVEFIIRGHRDEDLRALMNRVGCAWRAQERGDLTVFEFEIRVILKMEP
ncbi:Vacuolar protein sorting-associate Vta1 N-terminal [Penicillium chermesinum]|uniref:Vacuolar protein sorting-associate Vta1 N-terminal n=1 Tax=Penicillium chermesinum TaxID=63820 RepID=A0A9W9TW87_9EURO|nr:Vacuolar protein sorting-associate Vta1 N-terminal [Penicillium chermesinum]KAJ5245890.1 Vacuolar protein sorting-associate Vta1 N-terminal [Penicillium chermesinum]